MEKMRRVLTLVFAIVSILAVVLALFVAPLKASAAVSNAPSDVVLLVLIYLSEIFGSYLPLFV